MFAIKHNFSWLKFQPICLCLTQRAIHYELIPKRIIPTSRTQKKYEHIAKCSLTLEYYCFDLSVLVKSPLESKQNAVLHGSIFSAFQTEAKHPCLLHCELISRRDLLRGRQGLRENKRCQFAFWSFDDFECD